MMQEPTKTNKAADQNPEPSAKAPQYDADKAAHWQALRTNYAAERQAYREAWEKAQSGVSREQETAPERPTGQVPKAAGIISQINKMV